MNIYFQGDERVSAKQHINVNRDTASYRTSPFEDRKIEKSTYTVDISGTVMDNHAYAGHGQTAEDVMQMAEQEDVTARRNYMAVMSNSISDEDFAKLQREGFDPGSTDFETTVTIVDHIKAALVKGGTEIVGYTDTLSDETLCEITGSEAFAKELKAQFHHHDLPLTRENVTSVMESYEKLREVGQLSEGSMKYMVENCMTPTPDNLYTAQYSSMDDRTQQGKGYYEDGEISGYYAKKPDKVEMDPLLPQIVKVIEESKMEVNEETIQQAQWLIESGVPLHKDSLQRLHNLKTIVFPVSYENYLQSATAAIADGIPAGKADLTRRKSYLEEIQGKRYLEETRLQMSVEANLRLLKSGYQMDTASIEEVIAALKQIEEQMAKGITGEQDAAQAVEKANQFQHSVDMLTRIRTAPITFVSGVTPEDTLTDVERKATEEKRSYEMASEKYEEFMTAPRADLGDSIKKAFRNVEDILKELNLAITKANSRAVRILGYGQQEITVDSISRIKEKDALLTSVIEGLKPAKVLKMIRQGMDPTQMNLDDLNDFLKQDQDAAQDLESYSKFLYKLEQDKGITEDEREAYIGIYRLVHQIEKGDHAALSGALQAEMDLSLRNLLTVMRSTRKKSFQYVIDDQFGGVTRKETGVASITSQIEKGFQGDVADLRDLLEQAGDEEAQKTYEQQLYDDVRKAMQSEEAVLQQLTAYGQSATPNHMAAMDMLLHASSASFKKLNELTKEDLIPKGKKLLDQCTDKESAKAAFQEFTSDIQSFLEEAAFSEEHAVEYRSRDVKIMSDLYRQAGFLENLAQEENYEIPLEIHGVVTAVNLKVIHKKAQDPKVTVTFDSVFFGKTAAEFQYTGQGLRGYCVCTNLEGSRLLENEKDRFVKELAKENIMTDQLYFARSEVLNLKEFTLKQTKDRSSETEVSTDMLYKTAKHFIGFVQEIGIRKGNDHYEN